MVTRYASISLIAIDNPAYRRHCSQMAALTRSNRARSRPDERRHLAGLVEEVLRRRIGRSQELCAGRVLSWRELGSGQRWLQRYQELDAVTRPGPGELRVVEVKSTWSKDAARCGVRQLTRSMQMLSRVASRVSGLLVLADATDAGTTEVVQPVGPASTAPTRLHALPGDLSTLEIPGGEIRVVRLTAEELEQCAATVGMPSPRALARSLIEDEAAVAEQADDEAEAPAARCNGVLADKLRACLGLA